MGLDQLIWQSPAGASSLALMGAERPSSAAPVSKPAEDSFVGSAVKTAAAPPPPAYADVPSALARRVSPRAKVSILLVDDHPDTLSTLRRMLERQGYDVVAVACVGEALQWVDQNLDGTDSHTTPFDVLVSDIGLPDGDGCGLLRQLRDRFGDVRAVALSGYGMEVDRRASAAAGFAVHLVKPCGVQQLADALKQVLSTAPVHADSVTR